MSHTTWNRSCSDSDAMLERFGSPSGFTVVKLALTAWKVPWKARSTGSATLQTIYDGKNLKSRVACNAGVWRCGSASMTPTQLPELELAAMPGHIKTSAVCWLPQLCQ